MFNNNKAGDDFFDWQMAGLNVVKENLSATEYE